MPQADNQHLDFLISQYVDGTLEGAGKKSVEQKLLLDRAARALYADHRETQDLLDDWGNRLPMINWNEFDAKLADRLDQQTREQERVSIFRRRMKPVAVAAALLLAASLGYGWHAVSHGSGTQTSPLSSPVATADVRPKATVAYPDASGPRSGSAHFAVADDGITNLGQGIASDPIISPPENAVALESLRQTVQIGLKNVTDLGPISPSSPGAVVVDQYSNAKDEKDQQLPR